MKSIICLAVLYGFVSIVSSGQVIDSKSNYGAQAPAASAIVLVSKKGHWTIDELNQIAWDYLRSTGSIPSNVTVQSSVYIMKDDSSIFAQCWYLQGFGKDSWMVEIGSDGKARKYKKIKMMEGFRKGGSQINSTRQP